MKRLIQNKAWEINEDYNKEKLLYLLIDRPTKISILGSFFWLSKRKQLHREYDLPAIIYDDGAVVWCKNDKQYRNNNNKSAVIFNLK